MSNLKSIDEKKREEILEKSLKIIKKMLLSKEMKEEIRRNASMLERTRKEYERGLKKGEEVGIRLLKQKSCRYREGFFNGLKDAIVEKIETDFHLIC